MIDKPCNDHRPVQHRDGKPAWCRTCGLTAAREIPMSIFDRKEPGPAVQRYKDLGAQEVQAIQLFKENAEQVVDWCKGLPIEELDPFNTSIKHVGVNVDTFSGKKRLSEGQFLIRDSTGHFDVMAPSKFHAMYDPIQ